MSTTTVSIIVVSRGRPTALSRCLTAISQLIYDPFEIVVVADSSGVAAVDDLAFSGRLKIVRFDDANISVARNLGLAHAAGEIVCFIDDDAIPEPGWLFHLTQPFEDAGIAAAGGFVRGRNGISFQSKGQMINEFGYTTELPLASDEPQVFSGAPGRAIKTQGTNCAFRRDVLDEIGGFDPAFRYYLDETDLNMRIAARQMRTAIVPRAEVHHGVDASEMRQRSRMPLSLFEVGASQAVFLRKHATADKLVEVVADFSRAQRKTLIRHMVAGNCEPNAIESVMATLRAGLAEGATRSTTPTPLIPRASDPFLAFRLPSAVPTHKIIYGFRARALTLRRRAAEAAKRGGIVSLYLFSLTSRYHRVAYRDGYWEQAGGLFGKSDRIQPAFLFTRLKQRVKKEADRVAIRRYPRKTADQII